MAEEMKLCKGPNHPEGGGMVPLTNFSYHKTGERKGKPLARCKDCVNHLQVKDAKGPHGYVELRKVYFIFAELVARLGKAETARRIEMSRAGLDAIINKDNRYIQKKFFLNANEVLKKLIRSGMEGDGRRRKKSGS